MIILTIKTDQPEAEISIYEDERKLADYKWLAHYELSETIHSKIKELLTSVKKDWQDIEGVVVFYGPGSFTGLRIGISVANAMIYGLDCPGVGSAGKNWVADGIKKLISGQNDKIIKPHYGADVHITKPKH
jgi:tRNA threonylcarbamoyladenosine biosynthesis protein TsaB